MTIKSLIKAPKATVFRRAKIKRKSVVDGKYESEWFDISKDVKSYGKITSQVDSVRRFKLTFGTAKLTMENESGRYNPNDDPASTWFGYMNQQRTLVKIEAGYRYASVDANGINQIDEFPHETLWDEAQWDSDNDYVWDDEETSGVFVGLLSGDIPLTDKNEVALNIRPLVSVFQDFPARSLSGWTSTGMTASQFVTMVRDQTDGSGNFVFRPFFDDTTGNWDISTTSTVFSNLNTATATDVIDKTVWEVLEKLSEVESFVPYVSKDGVFKFISRASAEASVSFQFHGAGSFNSEYGQTIKNISSYGFRISKFYSRVQIKWRDESTSTAYAVEETALEVSATNNPWAYGVRTLSLENFYIPTSTVAELLALSIFNEVSALKKEIEFTTTFIPHLDLFDRVSIHYDPSSIKAENLWDTKDWADTATQETDDLIFVAAGGESLILDGEEFKFLSMEIDLDNFSNRFLAREI